MTLDERLEELRGADGTRRFYPPGQHPATARLRQQIAKMEFVGFGDTDFARYARDRLALFEELESEAKQRALRLLDRQAEDDGA